MDKISLFKEFIPRSFSTFSEWYHISGSEGYLLSTDLGAEVELIAHYRYPSSLHSGSISLVLNIKSMALQETTLHLHCLDNGITFESYLKSLLKEFFLGLKSKKQAIDSALSFFHLSSLYAFAQS